MTENQNDKLDLEAQLHKNRMQKQKEKVDAHIAAANIERGIALLLTGNGKGKTSSAFGMVVRAMGYQQKVGIVQFIKGAQESGEVNFIRKHGFTWDTQDKAADIQASEATWQIAQTLLEDESFDLVILDELTYMLGYEYLNQDTVIDAIQARPKEQSVVVTGRGGGRALREIMDTVSEVKNIKHAYKAGIKARKGVDC